MIDLLIKLGIGASFIVFAICLWLLKREKQKRKKTRGQDFAPPKLPPA
jgi:hypothetical protein